MNVAKSICVLACTPLIAAFLIPLSSAALASCTCECVNGQAQAMCSSAIDIQPICPPRICPITPPSITPINPPTLPPLGTTECHQAQVLNPYTSQYEWRQVCQ